MTFIPGGRLLHILCTFTVTVHLIGTHLVQNNEGLLKVTHDFQSFIIKFHGVEKNVIQIHT